MSVYQGMRGWLGANRWAWDALVVGVVLALTLLAGAGPPSGPPSQAADTSTPLSVALAVLAALTLFWRRSHPVVVWVAILALCLGALLVERGVTPAVLPLMVALYTVASVRPWRYAALAALGSAALLACAAWAVTTEPLATDATYALLAFAGMSSAIGIAVRNQRAVVAAAEERARIAELTRDEEAQARVTEERLRIARELHDVVAHHIAVINVQAGVAQHLMATDPAQAADALTHVRASSQVVLAELGTILGLLRTSEDDATRQPAPALAQLEELVESVRRAGLEVTWRVSGSPVSVPPGTDLAAYRLLQESLTNARKHGLGHAELSVHYTPDTLVLDVVNPVRHDRAELVRPGHGLAGMHERVVSLGGRLEAGPTAGDRFVVHAELPVAAASGEVA